MDILLVTFIGLLIGSFLNVCIYRVPRKKSISRPRRSYCPQCETQLSWFENIPVLSWILLGAKCRHCKKNISGQYPFVELLSGIAAAASFLRFGETPTAFVIYALTVSLVVITFIDFEFKIIPNVISYPGIIVGICVGIISQYTDIFTYPISKGALDSLLGLLFGAGFFLLIGEVYYRLAKRAGVGGGDIKLMAMTGALLGWKSIAPTIFVGSLFGAVIGIGLMLFQGKGRHTEIPFGPWLSLGAVLYIFTDIPFFRL